MTRREFLQQVERLLVRRRDALRQSLSAQLDQVGTRDQDVVGDAVDAASDTGHREVHSGLVETESRELASTERALQRLRAGRYGVCEEWDERIPIARLRALPYATMCIKCQQARERTQAEEWP